MPNKSQHIQTSLEKKILLLFPPGQELATFGSQVWRYYQQVILAPHNDEDRDDHESDE